MSKMDFKKLLSGGDLRSIGRSNEVVLLVRNQNEFDELFKFLFNADRLVVMRTADAIEKITIKRPEYLWRHKRKFFELVNGSKNKELQWHLALMMPRLKLNKREFGLAWSTLTAWAKGKTNSRIARVCSVQALSELSQQNTDLTGDLDFTFQEIEREEIPSINARIRIIRKQMDGNRRIG